MRILTGVKETTDSIPIMNSPSSGFRRAAAASWLLVGVGVAGTVGASVVAYAGTVQKQSGQIPAAEASPTVPLVVGTPTPTTSTAPSYSPHHTQSRGS